MFYLFILLIALNCSHYTRFKFLRLDDSRPHIRPLRGGRHHRARPHRAPARGSSLRPLSHPARPRRPTAAESEKTSAAGHFYNPTDSSQMELTSTAVSGSVRLIHLTAKSHHCKSKQRVESLLTSAVLNCLV